MLNRTLQQTSIALLIFAVAMPLQASSPEPLPKVFRIAALYPTVTGADDFVCVTKGAIAELSSTSKLAVEVEFFDTGNYALMTLAAAKKISVGGFDAAVGPRTSQEAIAASEVLNEAKVPLIVPMASNPEVTEGRNYVVRVVSNSRRYGKLLARYALKVAPPKHITIIRNQSLAFSTFGTKVFDENIRALSPKTPVDIIDIFDGFRDFNSVALKIKQNGSNVIYIPLYSPQASALFAELTKEGVEATMISNSGVWDGTNIFGNVVGQQSKIQLHFNGIWDQKFRGQHVAQFQRVLNKHCGGLSPNARNAAVFEAVAMLISTLNEKPSLRQLPLIEAIRKSNYSGLLGRFIPASDGDPVRDLPMFKFTPTGVRYLETLN